MQPVIEMLDALSERTHAPGHGGNRPCCLRVACGNEAEFLGKVSNVQRVNCHAVNIAAGVLFKHDEPVAIARVELLNRQGWYGVVHGLESFNALPLLP